MGSKRVTIIGGNGYVGRAMSAFLRSRGVPLQTPRSTEYNANQRGDLIRLIDDTRPDVIINCAGHTGKPTVDACENQKAECLRDNVLLPHLIRGLAREKGVIFGHVSSGCIFAGRRGDGGGFRETDPPNFSFRQDNCSFYSGSKAMGEEVLGYQTIQRADGGADWHNPSPDCYLWRLRIPFSNSDGPRNYLTKVMNYPMLLNAENSLTRLQDFASGCWQIIEKDLSFGLFHVSNPGAITTSEVTELIKKIGRDKERQTGTNPFPRNFNFFENEEHFVSFLQGAPRSNCVLDTSKIENLGIRLPDVRVAVTECLMNWTTQGPLPENR